MDIHVTDDKLGGYFRRYQLALRMMAHGARTQTVIAWSGLTRDQLVTQRQRWGFGPDERRRGPAPTALRVFFQSRRRRGDAALFASLSRIVGATGARTGKAAAACLPNLEHGERLCEALEAFREWRPEAALQFEHAVLLATGIVEASAVTLAQCSNCHAAMLIDRRGANQSTCEHCLQRRASPLTADASSRREVGPTPSSVSGNSVLHGE